MKKPMIWGSAYMGLIALLMILNACRSPVDPAAEDPGERAGSGTGSSAVEDATGGDKAADLDASFSPATTLAEASIERGRDYAKGAEEPLLTIVEYGDFQ